MATRYVVIVLAQCCNWKQQKMRFQTEEGLKCTKKRRRGEHTVLNWRCCPLLQKKMERIKQLECLWVCQVEAMNDSSDDDDDDDGQSTAFDWQKERKREKATWTSAKLSNYGELSAFAIFFVSFFFSSHVSRLLNTARQKVVAQFAANGE